MSTLIHKPIVPGKFSNQNLQEASFKNEDLSNVDFSGSDLRGADFTGANLKGANFSSTRTGITFPKTILIFIVTLFISALSGYVAMLSGVTVQKMVRSQDEYIKMSGYITLGIIVLFIAYYYWKGGSKSLAHLIIRVVVLAAIIGLISYFSGVGTGRGMLYLIMALILVAIMFFVGTIARATAGTLSNILFVIVALSGGMFGKSVGGGIGTVIMAISCAMISKRALSGAKGFATLRKIAFYITRKFGTSFRNSNLTEANFSQSKIQNVDFTDADMSFVNWGDSKKINCIADGNIMKAIKNEKHG